MRDLSRQLLRREPFHEFLDEPRLVFLDTAINPDPKWKDELRGAETPEPKLEDPKKKRRRRDSANSKNRTDIRLS